ncbi:uncharacterized protein LOC129950477 [Eupeodes corollae]|uniref:uncharacterized protein LOC129950477 n=1 Tax=Eupeodes corollae TaxID=290404 RepID=UPI00248F9F4F|nr:uncharacterized protein LOC129950477 [Eupeodes corollae]
MADSNAKALELLFQRPLEPIFTSRDNGRTAFDVPDTFITNRYGDSGLELQSRFGDSVDRRIPVRDITKPNLDFTMKISLTQNFEIFNDKHQQIAGKLIKMFIDVKELENFIALAAYVKDRVNPMLFQYAYSVAIQHRPDTKNVSIPPIAEQFPANFVEPSVLRDARAVGSLIPNAGDRMNIDMTQNFTASDLEQEQRLAYFREDIGVNMHHWHWHLVYPAEGPDAIVRKDRRGELFYYMHQQIIARYNVERFCNGLPRARLLNNLREPIPEGYFPKILSSLSNRTFPSRIAMQSLKNLEREDNVVDITDVERWADRIHQAIDQGYVVDRNNRQIPLDEVKGIDILGDIIEASSLSPNRQLYGNLHNMGHNLISLAHDPDARFKENIGVMGDVTTAMRDPIFYRWHSHIDLIFRKFKGLLPSYNNSQLGFSGVNVDSLDVQIRSKGTTPNILATYWQNSDIDIAAALDFGPNGAIYARYTHLQHAPFEYDIKVTNSGANRRGTCRIFLCPKTDERGTTLKMDEVKNMAIELDKFTVTLNPGQNTIKRRSNQSSLTIPFERSFRRIIPDVNRPPESEAEYRFCGCGWPDHMLLPKGKAEGMEFDLFCMISDYTGDEVMQTNDEQSVCADADSFCGLKDKLYPDKRSMGYPFDRNISSPNIGEFVNQYTNMRITPIKIVFANKTVNRPKSNNELWRRTGQRRLDIDIRKRKKQWIGHTLRKPNDDIAKQSFEWNPQGSRCVGRPRTTWKSTVLSEANSQRKKWPQLRKSSLLAMDNDIKAMELLFQRPLEPVFTSRDNGKAAFDVPDSFFTDRYSGAGIELQSRFGDDVDVKIPLRDIAKPNLDFATQISRKQTFDLFSDKHKRIAGQLIKMFLDVKERSLFVSLAAYVKDRINPMLFQYAYTVAVQHRKDTAMVPIPPVAEQFPGNFIEPSVFKDARAEGSLITNPGDRMTIDMSRNFTASDREEEQRLAYFREDIGVNMHHWHWHLVYPGEGPDEVVRKDRRGELFYYMHHQLLARYNVERFCNGLSRTRVLSSLRDAIPEGYFPKIISSLNNRTYPARITGQKLRNVEREDNAIEIAEVERWADRIHQAIDQGYVVDRNNKQIPLDEVKGIDILGDMLEASSLTPNRQLYGNLHNMGHNLISLAHDPDSRHLEDIGVMGDVTTAMRDPIFYRWHSFIDQIFLKFKGLLPAYDESQLGFNGVNVDGISVQITSKGTTPNILATFWQNSDIDIGAGLDFGPNGAIFARYSHLQHAPFEYNIKVTNTGASRRGTCRIFLCPKADERGAPLKMAEVKNLAIEMDKFTVNLKPGQNTIKRRSSESSVTIPFERSFRRIDTKNLPKGDDALAEFRFCGCGWPEHMLLPKGTAEGLEFDLFVMISDYTGDEVKQINDSPSPCGDAESFCGLKDKLYPDKRGMGYPFDRQIASSSLETFTNAYTNMGATPVKIVYSNKHINRMKK